MKRQFFQITSLVLLAMLGLLLLSGCNLMPALTGGIPSATWTPVPDQLPDPKFGRDQALAFIRTNYPDLAPGTGLVWVEENLTPSGLVGASSFRYSAEKWTLTVTYPIVAPSATIYTVSVNSDRMTWEGLVDAFGQVVQTSVALQPSSSGNQDDQATTEPEEEPTDLPTPTPTPTATPTSTTPPTQAPTPTATPIPPTPTPKPLPCNAAKFISDVTVADGTLFTPGVDFTKTWRLKNAGTCNWTTDYDLVFVKGDRMDGAKAIALKEKVKPGETIDLSVAMTAPDKPDDYQGFWMLRSADGEVFGLGSEAEDAFWVEITVIKSSGDFEYDFSFNYCAAKWRSETLRLSCPGDTESTDGFVGLLKNPALESRHENEPALWVHPNDDRYGWIEGTYPAYKVRNGDHFKAWVGCLEGNTKCDVTFYLAYENANGKVITLHEWDEVYDNQVTQIDINLSDLAGDSVKFILGMQVNTKNVDDANGFWFVPRIVQPDASTGLDKITPGA